MSDDERKDPIWKKEISFGRKPSGDATPDAQPRRALDAELEEIKAAAIAAVMPDPPKPPPVRRATKPLPPEPEELPEPPELTELPAPPAPPQLPEPAPAAETVWVEPKVSVPFWKRELGKPKTPKAAKEPKAAKASKEPKAPKQKSERAPRDPEAKPFWKKEFALSRSRAPKEPKEPKQKAEKAEKAEQDGAIPFWKRELAVGTRKVSVAKSKKTKEKKEKEPSDKPAHEGFKLKMPRLERPARAKRGSNVPKRLVGLKIGASQLAAARVSNNGSAELLQIAREALAPGIIVGGELREPELLADALREFSQQQQPSEAQRASRHCEQPHRRSLLRDRRHRRSGAARQRDSLPCAGGAADSDRGGRARLPDPRRVHERRG